jgi:hypothetical protein
LVVRARGVHGGKFGKRRQYQFRLVELTCGALGTDPNSAPDIKRRESQRETQLSVLEDITRISEPKWNTYSSGCQDAPSDFGSLSVQEFSSNKNISIIAMVNFGINAS